MNSLCVLSEISKSIQKGQSSFSRGISVIIQTTLSDHTFILFSLISSSLAMQTATPSRDELPIPVLASTVYIKPITKHKNVGLRLELYGCKGGIILRTISLIQLKFVNKRNCTKHQTLDFTCPTIINTTIYNMIPGLHV